MTCSILRRLVASAAGTGTFVLPAAAIAQAGPDGRYYHMMGGGGWGHWIIGPVMMLLFLALAVALAVVLVRWLGGDGRPPADTHEPGSARAILERRFARGEIDEEEFQRRKRVLEI